MQDRELPDVLSRDLAYLPVAPIRSQIPRSFCDQCDLGLLVVSQFSQKALKLWLLGKAKISDVVDSAFARRDRASESGQPLLSAAFIA